MKQGQSRCVLCWDRLRKPRSHIGPQNFGAGWIVSVSILEQSPSARVKVVAWCTDIAFEGRRDDRLEWQVQPGRLMMLTCELVSYRCYGEYCRRPRRYVNDM